jgi:hypothetical protein
MQQLGELREHAWQYFQTHASQRLTTFNFYLVAATLLATGVLATFHKDFSAQAMGVFMGSLLAFTSFTFWKLDQRNRQLIRNAETALQVIENKTRAEGVAEDELRLMRLFDKDASQTSERIAKRRLQFWLNTYSYSDCFNAMFLAFASLGVIGAALAAVRLLHKS